MTKLNAEQRARFRDEGYLVVEQLFNPAEDLDPVIEEYHGVLDRLAEELYKQQEIPSTYAGESFSERLIRICEAIGRVQSQYFDFSLPQKAIRADTPMWVGPGIFDVLRNEHLLDAVESLIGPEIYSNPVQHVRLKLPEDRGVRDADGKVLDGMTPWHQDNGVILPEADETDMLTIWFPLWDSPIESGCLQLIPRSHRRGLLTHCPLGAPGVGIPQKSIEEERPIPVPMKRGDALFMHRLMCHGSLPNRSKNVRWSFDLRYHPIGQPTGRGAFPGFVARSRAHPEQELHDPEQWAQSWYEARATLAQANELRPFNRWDGKAAVCA